MDDKNSVSIGDSISAIFIAGHVPMRVTNTSGRHIIGRKMGWYLLAAKGWRREYDES